MRRTILAVLLTLAFILIAGAAPADYAYTETSQIPMAVDFSVSVEFDARGNPRIVTDYPFAETGATELNLVYNKGDVSEAVTLRYSYPSGVTSVAGWNSALYDDESIREKVYEEIRSGELVLDDSVYINTGRNSAETDWVLEYSLSRHSYLSYEEKTFSQGFNAMGSGGVSGTLYYEGDELSSSRVMKRTDSADLVIERSRTGDVDYAGVFRYQPSPAAFDYDASTGLFGGYRLSGLGFEDSDIELDPLAVTGRTTSTVVVADDVPAAAAKGPAATRIAGGLLIGLLIGLTLFRMFRSRKSRPAKPVSSGDAIDTDESPVREETPEPPVRHMSR